MKKPLVSLSLLALSACPAPLDSIDGLAGGALTSKVTAPAVATTEVATDTLDATGEVTAAGVTAGTVTSSGAVVGSSVIVQRGNARVGFFGLVVGATPQVVGETGADAEGTTPNYAVRQRACAAAFPATSDGLPAAHVCTAQEAMAHALQSPDTVPVSASGGIVHTYGHYWFAGPNDGGSEQRVTDCAAMAGGNSAGTSSSLRLHHRDDGAWSLRIENGCTQVDEPLVCCQ